MDKLELRERLPDHLLADPYTANVAEAMLASALTAKDAVASLADQLCVNTATWALDRWEALVGITPGRGQTLEERRGAVVAKLCSTGTTNAEMIRALAEALTGYGATVTENYGDYSFSLRFFGETSGFINIDAKLLTATVEEIKPAHLLFIIEAITWADLEAADLTWLRLEEQFESWAALESSFYCHKEGGP